MVKLKWELKKLKGEAGELKKLEYDIVESGEIECDRSAVIGVSKKGDVALAQQFMPLTEIIGSVVEVSKSSFTGFGRNFTLNTDKDLLFVIETLMEEDGKGGPKPMKFEFIRGVILAMDANSALTVLPFNINKIETLGVMKINVDTQEISMSVRNAMTQMMTGPLPAGGMPPLGLGGGRRLIPPR